MVEVGHRAALGDEVLGDGLLGERDLGGREGGVVNVTSAAARAVTEARKARAGRMGGVGLAS